MNTCLENIQLGEIEFLTEIHSNRYAVIFLVSLRNQTCIMKVHHGRGPRRHYEPTNRELDIRVLESTAYQRLKERGICDRGIVPDYLGTIRKSDPSKATPACQPYLKMFLEDEYPPSALFLEYIPGLEMITLENYTKQRLAKFVDGIRQIHKAFVLHDDPKPRNMMVVKDTADRVIWLDFDRAKTWNEDTITDKQVGLIEEEDEIVDGFANLLASDHAKKKIEDTYIMYCT